MLEFMGQLLKDVEFQDVTGNTVTVSSGEIVSILSVLDPQESIDVCGKPRIEAGGSFIATCKGISFDIEPNDFEKVHAC